MNDIEANLPKYVAEVLGTFTLVFIGSLSILASIAGPV